MRVRIHSRPLVLACLALAAPVSRANHEPAPAPFWLPLVEVVSPAVPSAEDLPGPGGRADARRGEAEETLLVPTRYAYDSMNRLVEVRHDGAWKTGFVRDLNGRVVIQGSGYDLSYFERDAVGRVTEADVEVYDSPTAQDPPSPGRQSSTSTTCPATEPT